ncbi:uncharacterized protein EI90DRAFT_3069993 [Cantharellus anzutake]|uniref:uncharacterized protein n=1 Tax=Cantharellus anzutake TaxID=1750568 RepID=UPI001907D8EC|nr:uncharacterized protein EI90DRAFT_3069993 [Cantharellus anzutake]KAF8326631.1 hypothetical protein EI90DRAFT_3069993 [Cantharellus anzutake]
MLNTTPRVDPPSTTQAPIWWSNIAIFCGVHILAFFGAFSRPILTCPYQTLVLSFISWRLAMFGITIGYHRLWSHRSFTAGRPLRVILAAMGCSGFQGSIKWWCARHRLHHRYTDDPEHDPYSATRGLLYSHMGWIFCKPKYARLSLVDVSDLDNDPVVILQHKYYVPLAVDTWGGFIYGGLISRLLVWHCTFLVNSFAHWNGHRLYSDEMSARGNLLMALLTGGEGNHNFHAFPIRMGSSGWIIHFLYRHTNFITSVKTADYDDIIEARRLIAFKSQSPDRAAVHVHGTSSIDDGKNKELPHWNSVQIERFVVENGRSLLLVDSKIVDVTDYMLHHPGGFRILREDPMNVDFDHESSLLPLGSEQRSTGNRSSTAWKPKDATWAFDGGMNNHSHIAKRKLSEMAIALFSPSSSSITDANQY